MNAEPFGSLAGNGKWDEYCNLLCDKGPDWWFNLEIPLLIEHLQPILQSRHVRIFPDDVTGFPARLILLSELTRPVMSIDVLNSLFATLKSDNDLRGASVCAGAGVHAIWERGYGLGELEAWYQRIKDLLRETEERLGFLARASLLGFKGLVEVTGLGDTALAVETLSMQRSCAEKARSSSLQIYGAFLLGYCCFFEGRICELEQVISGTIPIANLPDTSDIAGGYFGLLQGIFYVVTGDIDKGRTVIKTILEKPAFETFPQSLRNLCLGIFMTPLVYEQDAMEIETLSERISLKTVQRHNLFHHAFLSLLWGITALNSNKPYRALFYAREAIEKSHSSGGRVIESIASLLLGQALTDLNETDDAKSHLNSWQEIWERSGLHMFATAGALELVNIALREGRTNDARRYYEDAVRLYPDCEHFRHILRPPGFVDRINRSMHMGEDDHTVWWPSVDKIIRIRTFGALQLQIGDHTFLDHEWRSWRTKMLLKSLIVYGGVKVSVFKIAMLLWPDAEGDRAIGNLKVALFRLRQLGVSKRICIPAWVHLQYGRLSLSHWLCSVDSLAFDKSFTMVMREGGIEELNRLLDLYADDCAPQAHNGSPLRD